jgi:hypothetical protein
MLTSQASVRELNPLDGADHFTRVRNLGSPMDRWQEGDDALAERGDQTVLFQNASVSLVHGTDESRDGYLLGGQFALIVMVERGCGIQLALESTNVILKLADPRLPSGQSVNAAGCQCGHGGVSGLVVRGE